MSDRKRAFLVSYGSPDHVESVLKSPEYRKDAEHGLVDVRNIVKSHSFEPTRHMSHIIKAFEFHRAARYAPEHITMDHVNELKKTATDHQYEKGMRILDEHIASTRKSANPSVITHLHNTFGDESASRMNSGTPSSISDEYARRREWDYVATSHNARPEHLRQAFESSMDRFVHARVAEHHNTPEDVLHKIIGGSDSFMAHAAKANLAKRK